MGGWNALAGEAEWPSRKLPKSIVLPVRSERNPFVGTRPFPLENGDRLTRREFERRYAARTDIKKAELIEGCRPS